MDQSLTTALSSNRTPFLATLAVAAVGAFVLHSAAPGPLKASGAAMSLWQSAAADPATLPSSGALAAATGNATLSPAVRAEFEALIKDYLLRNPEVMVDVQTALETKMEKIQSEKSAVALKDNASEIFQPAVPPVAGNPKGDVTVVEFFDYNCGYCKKALPDVTALVQSDKNIRFVLKEFPILSKGSEEASKVALAAKMQGKYWEFHLAMLGLQGQANEASALKVAERVGVDMARLKTDMVSPAVKKEIDDTRALAQKMGINGTPHFLVGDKVIAGAPENLPEVLAGDISDVRKAGGCKVCGG